MAEDDLLRPLCNGEKKPPPSPPQGRGAVIPTERSDEGSRYCKERIFIFVDLTSDRMWCLIYLERFVYSQVRMHCAVKYDEVGEL